MSRNVIRRGIHAAVLAALSSTLSSAARAAVSASIVPGTLTQGTVKTSLGAGTTYDVESNNMGDWPLNTGGTSTTTYGISYENPAFNGNAYGGTPNTMVAFGAGGGVTLRFGTPITPVPGERDLGIFTAQAITSGAYTLNGNMEAAILVSADGNAWYTLSGTPVASPATYTATVYPLNAPTMAYNYGTGAVAWKYGAGTSAANLGALPVADYTTPMPDDDLFNGSGTNAQRQALTTDASASDYNAIFGDSGGGNWFDISGSGLSEVDYVRLNGDANEADNSGGAASGGVRLDAVFANDLAVPEPASLALFAWAAAALLKRRRNTPHGLRSRAEQRFD
jgi:hypothetical protein